MDIYSTKIENRSPVGVRLFDHLAGFIQPLGPGEAIELQAVDKLATYARYESVVFFKSKVELGERPGWVAPDLGKIVIRVLNVAGVPVEFRMIGGHNLALMKGIPVQVGLTKDDPMAGFESYEIRGVTAQKPRILFPGYLM